MSGGHFDYNQYKIREIADEVEQEILRSGRKKTKEELKDESWKDSDWYERYPEDLCHRKYPKEVLDEFKKGLLILRQAEVYAQRIDWLLSGDDGDDTFIERLHTELADINNKYGSN